MQFFDKTIPSKIYRFVQLTYRIVTHYPLHGLALLLSFQVATRIEPNNYLRLARLDQCSLNENLILFETVCYPEDELYQHYHVIKNTASIRDVKYFYFTEIHNVAAHHTLEPEFVNKIGNPGDTVLFEGINANITFCCSTPFFNYNFEKDEYALRYQINCSTDNPTDGIKNFTRMKFKDHFTCQGWDNEELMNKYYPRMVANAFVGESLAKRYKIYNNCWEIMGKFSWRLSSSIANTNRNIFNNISYDRSKDAIAELNIEIKKIMLGYTPIVLNRNLSNSHEFLNNIKKELLAFITYYEKDYQDYRKEAHIVSKNILSERNAKGLQVINSINSSRIFSFFGMGHFLPNITCRREECFFIEKNTYQYEIRKALEDKPHAILIPKI